MQQQQRTRHPIMGACADSSGQQDSAADMRLLRKRPRMAPQRLFLRALTVARNPPPPSLSRSRSSNGSSRRVTTERIPPPQAPGTEWWRGLATTTQAAEPRTPHGRGGRDGGCGPGNGRRWTWCGGFGMMVRARCSAGPTRGDSGVRTISSFSHPRRSVAPDGVPQPGLVSQDLFFGEGPGTAALPPMTESVSPQFCPHIPHVQLFVCITNR